ncbi:hypothetical protein [Longirhabdus pacifica]|uniref:hypothetical protein n=1 Tax=Longirhabdus pacifica TaxID=2305227 RepID=UPI00100883EC|nr:hypothetical protein [Longirhabdus pacifica]
MTITVSNTLNNVVLLPQAMEHFQHQLTTLMEEEKYKQAEELIHFLLQCQVSDESIITEWEMILTWIQSQTQHHKEPASIDAAIEEEAMFEHYVQQKQEENQGRGQELIQTLLSEDTTSREKWIALEQLVYIEDKDTNDKLKKWVQETEIHPLLQFRVLQVLRTRKASGTLFIQRCGEEVKVQIGRIPASIDEFPKKIKDILQRLTVVCESNNPSMIHFAEQIWTEFISAIYGTKLYDQMKKELSANQIKMWALVLHIISSEMIQTDFDLHTLVDEYQIAPTDEAAWKVMYYQMKEIMDEHLHHNI